MINQMIAGQTVCNRKDEKGKSCHGSLKYYYPFCIDFGETDAERLREISGRFGRDPWLKLYQCNVCNAIYHP